MVIVQSEALHAAFDLVRFRGAQQCVVQAKGNWAERERWVSTGWCVNCGFGQTSQAACHPDHASDIPCRHNTLRASGWLPIKITDRHSIEVCPVACPQRTSSSARTWEERSLRFRGQPSDYNPQQGCVSFSSSCTTHHRPREHREQNGLASVGLVLSDVWHAPHSALLCRPLRGVSRLSIGLSSTAPWPASRGSGAENITERQASCVASQSPSWAPAHPKTSKGCCAPPLGLRPSSFGPTYSQTSNQSHRTTFTRSQ